MPALVSSFRVRFSTGTGSTRFPTLGWEHVLAEGDWAPPLFRLCRLGFRGSEALHRTCSCRGSLQVTSEAVAGAEQAGHMEAEGDHAGPRERRDVHHLADMALLLGIPAVQSLGFKVREQAMLRIQYRFNALLAWHEQVAAWG